jgi:N-acetylmuramoyl-L-alanine amidase
MKFCIDPGHGMSNKKPNVFDPGCTHTENGVQFLESDIVLRYGLKLKDVLLARGIGVFMTRDDATDHAPVGQRARNARAAGCEAFVSIHVNDADSDEANGFEVLYGAPKHKELAQKMQTALLAVMKTADHKMKDRKIKLRDDLAVLAFKGPAVLIELGFISFDKDRDLITNPQIRERVCETIADVLESK